MNLPKYKKNLKVEGCEVYSYGTKVAMIGSHTVMQLGYWSQTTQKHINYVASELNLPIAKPAGQ
jgi:hypothetical protein